MNKTIMKRIIAISASVLITLMVFGIGINSIEAATTKPASTPGNLQPATGQSEYRNMDSTTHTSGEVADEEAVQASGEHSTESKEKESEETGVVGMFGLNWKLFLAQLINFGIILFVLWKWVFGPVTKGLSQRTEKIEHSLADAQRITEERETFDSWKQGEISQVRTEAAEIISQAKSDAEKLKTETLEKTKQEQLKIVESAQVKLEAEKQAMLNSVKDDLAELVVTATQAVLKQKLDPKKDGALIEQAISEAKNIDSDSKGDA